MGKSIYEAMAEERARDNAAYEGRNGVRELREALGALTERVKILEEKLEG